MKKKRLYYWRPLIGAYSNFGDDLNGVLFEKLFGVELMPCRINHQNADYWAIGSILDRFMGTSGRFQTIKKILNRMYYVGSLFSNRNDTITILGSGFSYYHDKVKYLKKMDFRVVRGKKSEEILRRNGLIKSDIVIGDPGLLTSYLYNDNTWEKRYKLGIIPILKDQASPIIGEICRKYGTDAVLINVKDGIDRVVEQIASCEQIVSSSLHGLIVSDSFGIPNLWIENNYKSKNPYFEKIDPFKYRDYYSVYDLEIDPVDTADFLRADISLIKKSYQINKTKVKAKQKELYNFFKNYFEANY